ARYRIRGADGAVGRVAPVHEHRDDTAGDNRAKINDEKTEFPQHLLDCRPEEKQRQHVEQEMRNAPVKKGRGDYAIMLLAARNGAHLESELIEKPPITVKGVMTDGD